MLDFYENLHVSVLRLIFRRRIEKILSGICFGTNNDQNLMEDTYRILFFDANRFFQLKRANFHQNRPTIAITIIFLALTELLNVVFCPHRGVYFSIATMKV